MIGSTEPNDCQKFDSSDGLFYQLGGHFATCAKRRWGLGIAK